MKPQATTMRPIAHPLWIKGLLAGHKRWRMVQAVTGRCSLRTRGGRSALLRRLRTAWKTQNRERGRGLGQIGVDAQFTSVALLALAFADE
jgi:hypothetical protein